MKRLFFLLFAALAACEEIDHAGEQTGSYPAVIPPEEVVRLLAALPIGEGQVAEVRDAVTASVANGYDEEYRMADLFAAPGTGVGDPATKAPGDYEVPLRDLIGDYVRAAAATKAGLSAEDYLQALAASDMQIYWPFSELEEGRGEWPVITYDPDDGSTVNVGYRIREEADGSRRVEEIIVDEAYARHHPVWVVNRNDDAGYPTLETLRRDHPEWGSDPGGTLVVGPLQSGWAPASKTGASGLRSLVLKAFKMRRQFDPWLAGASEFFVKLGAIDDFYASTEAELLLYQPLITDFMIVVRRLMIAQELPFNVVLVSNWTDQLQTCALMITEDDGGTQTTWKAEGEVKIKSKTYGFGVSLPFHTRDDIVWRGSLSGKYFEHYSDVPSRFGDVDLTFSLVER